MREFLFRGKATNREKGRAYRTSYKNGDWVYGLLTNAENYAGFSEITNTNGVSGIEVDKNTVGQFTGLTDKNGKKIFEGDIVEIVGDAREFITEEQLRYVVNWQDEDCGFRLLIMFDYEVIGNIHDNPELLEVNVNAQ